MDLKGAIVTADAMNCQKDTAVTIKKAKRDYVLELKGSQPLFYEEGKIYFDDAMKEKQKGGCYYKTVEKEYRDGGEKARKARWYKREGKEVLYMQHRGRCQGI